MYRRAWRREVPNPISAQENSCRSVSLSASKEQILLRGKVARRQACYQGPKGHAWEPDYRFRHGQGRVGTVDRKLGWSNSPSYECIHALRFGGPPDQPEAIAHGDREYPGTSYARRLLRDPMAPACERHEAGRKWDFPSDEGIPGSKPSNGPQGSSEVKGEHSWSIEITQKHFTRLRGSLPHAGVDSKTFGLPHQGASGHNNEERPISGDFLRLTLWLNALTTESWVS